VWVGYAKNQKPIKIRIPRYVMSEKSPVPLVEEKEG